jgi:hypothetical protein
MGTWSRAWFRTSKDKCFIDPENRDGVHGNGKRLGNLCDADWMALESDGHPMSQMKNWICHFIGINEKLKQFQLSSREKNDRNCRKRGKRIQKGCEKT